MAPYHRPPRGARARTKRAVYLLIVRGRDGRPRYERFDSAAAYRARLAALKYAPAGDISIDELAGLLDSENRNSS